MSVPLRDFEFLVFLLFQEWLLFHGVSFAKLNG
nr:MAG TPA: hypothetical protein [Bacteriophage sp.]